MKNIEVEEGETLIKNQKRKKSSDRNKERQEKKSRVCETRDDNKIEDNKENIERRTEKRKKDEEKGVHLKDLISAISSDGVDSLDSISVRRAEAAISKGLKEWQTGPEHLQVFPSLDEILPVQEMLS